MTADDQYFLHNRKNLPLPIQMQLSNKPMTFWGFFIAFLESTLTFVHFEKKQKKAGPYGLSISEINGAERRGYRNA